MSEKPANSKITLTWDDLNTRKVESRLKEQDALARTRRYAQMQPDAVAAAPATGKTAGSIFYNAIVYMALFGLVGGFLAWTVGMAMEQSKPPGRQQASELLSAFKRTQEAQRYGRLKPEDAKLTIDEIRWMGRNNPHFLLALPAGELAEPERAAAGQLLNRNELKVFIANVIAYGLCGILIAVCLAVAEPLVERNFSGAIINGSVAAALGLLGGVVVAFVVERLYSAVAGASGQPIPLSRQVLARTVTWGVLGIFLTLAPGIVMANVKKLGIGLAGGLIGGLIGGLLFEPVRQLTDRPELSQLVALLTIGLVAGAGTGLIENVAKTGWVRVIAGLIAGKQFILYRNPTFIGSGPDCQIFLFKDPNVGRRHAALHIVPGGFEIEDLPLGAPTYVNEKPITRVRLRNGDRIAVGATTLLFQAKASDARTS